MPQRGGIAKPILRGLRFLGVVCRAVVDDVLETGGAKVARYHPRFAGESFPGGTILTSVWRGRERLPWAAETKERNAPVLSNAAIGLRA